MILRFSRPWKNNASFVLGITEVWFALNTLVDGLMFIGMNPEELVCFAFYLRQKLFLK